MALIVRPHFVPGNSLLSSVQLILCRLKFFFFVYPLDSSQKKWFMWILASSVISLFAIGSAVNSVTKSICKKNHLWVGFNFRFGRTNLLKHNGASSICCSFSTEKDPLLPSIQQLTDARLIYSVSAALGHNKVLTCYFRLFLSVPLNPFCTFFFYKQYLFSQESHPECSARVPAIVTALEKNELTPKAWNAPNSIGFYVIFIYLVTI